MFQFGDKLGVGGFATCFKDRCHNDGNIYALKVIPAARLATEQDRLQLRREVTIQRQLSHPHVVQMFGYFLADDTVNLVLEFVENGNLYEHLQKIGRLSEYETALYVYQCADALSYLHANQIIHRDLKLDNCLLDSDYNIKLADFGASLKSPELMGRTLCGTRLYLSPERYTMEKYDHSVDIWALGIMMYELITGEHPFDWSQNDEDLDRRIQKAIFSIPTQIVPKGARDIIRRLVVKEPRGRMPLKDLMCSQWIMSVLDGSPVEETATGGKTTAKEELAKIKEEKAKTCSSIVGRIQLFEKLAKAKEEKKTEKMMSDETKNGKKKEKMNDETEDGKKTEKMMSDETKNGKKKEKQASDETKDRKKKEKQASNETKDRKKKEKQASDETKDRKKKEKQASNETEDGKKTEKMMSDETKNGKKKEK